MKQKLMICAALVLAVSNLYATTDKDSLEGSESFRDLAELRAQKSTIPITRYYRIVGPTHVSTFIPDVYMGDISNADELRRKLNEEKMSNSTNHNNHVDATHVDANPILDALEAMQRAVGDTEHFGDGRGPIYVKHRNGHSTTFVKKTPPLNVNTDSQESIAAAIRTLAEKAAKKQEEEGKIIATLRDSLPATEFDNIRGKLSMGATSEAIKYAIQQARKNPTAQ